LSIIMSGALARFRGIAVLQNFPGLHVDKS
jgi:hypothetical protein